MTLRFDAIGTRWTIAIHDYVPPAAQSALEWAIAQRIEAFDRTYSRFRGDSLVTQMAAQAGRHELPADGFRLLSVYERLYRATAGAVTPLIGQAMADAGYDAAYSFQPKPLTAPPAWNDTIRYDPHGLTLARPALLDFGAAGKGYLVDIVAGVIADAGVRSFLIDAGGDLLHRSDTLDPVRVGLENPRDHGQALGIVQLSNRSLCASSGSRRTWGAYHHIIDPHTLRSPRQVLATWVMAADTITADGLATALFFVPARQLRPAFTFSYAVLYDDMTLTRDRHFPAEVFEAMAA